MSLINFRDSQWLYQVGKGEQGVFQVEPYKSELLPYWRFRTPEEAKNSAQVIYNKFLEYKEDEDFPGMDMARKFLQMGFTRSRRYANHRSGRKYDGPVPDNMKGISGSHGRKALPLDKDLEKEKSAEIFFKFWKRIEKDTCYRQMKSQWKEWFG